MGYNNIIDEMSRYWDNLTFKHLYEYKMGQLLSRKRYPEAQEFIENCEALVNVMAEQWHKATKEVEKLRVTLSEQAALHEVAVEKIVEQNLQLRNMECCGNCRWYGQGYPAHCRHAESDQFRPFSLCVDAENMCQYTHMSDGSGSRWEWRGVPGPFNTVAKSPTT
jgi:hypothetical protein